MNEIMMIWIYHNLFWILPILILWALSPLLYYYYKRCKESDKALKEYLNHDKCVEKKEFCLQCGDYFKDGECIRCGCKYKKDVSTAI